MKNIRNIIIAIVILAFLLVEPFWPKIKSAITGQDAQSGASPAVSQSEIQEE